MTGAAASATPNSESLVAGSVLVIGIGNEFRQDDGVGIEVARRLRRIAPAGIRIFERSGEATDLIAAWSGAACVLVIDAVSSGAEPGTVHRFELGGAGSTPESASPGPRPPSRIFRGTSHQLGLGEAIELAAAVGELPGRLVVYGIEGRDFGEGTQLSPPVARAVDDVVARIAGEAARPPYRTRRSSASDRPTSA